MHNVIRWWWRGPPRLKLLRLLRICSRQYWAHDSNSPSVQKPRCTVRSHCTCMNVRALEKKFKLKNLFELNRLADLLWYVDCCKQILTDWGFSVCCGDLMKREICNCINSWDCYKRKEKIGAQVYSNVHVERIDRLLYSYILSAVHFLGFLFELMVFVFRVHCSPTSWH